MERDVCLSRSSTGTLKSDFSMSNWKSSTHIQTIHWFNDILRKLYQFVQLTHLVPDQTPVDKCTCGHSIVGCDFCAHSLLTRFTEHHVDLYK